MQSKFFKVGLAQIDILWENKTENQKKIEYFFKKAFKQKVRLLIFPEMTFSGFTMNTTIFDSAASELSQITEKCIRYNMYAGVGYGCKENDEAKNCFAIISPDGKILSNYAKTHLFSHADEHIHYSRGEEVVFAEIENFCVSTFVCYDLRFPEIFQFASSRANVLIVTANWPKSRINHWKNLLVARAIESQCYVIGVNRVGIGNSIEYSGSSMIINPYGKIISELSDKETLIIENLNISDIVKIREEFNTMRDRQISLYKKFYI